MDTSIHRVLSSNQNSSEQNKVLMFSFGLIAALSFGGNVILCVVILRRRFMLKQPYNVLIFNLAVTDLLTGEIFILIVLFAIIQLRKTWYALYLDTWTLYRGLLIVCLLSHLRLIKALLKM